jgi:nucleoid DNA-binding protein
MASKKAAPAAAAGGKKLTKSQVIGSLSEKTGVAKKDVASIFGGLSELIKRELGKKGPGEFVIPDLLKLKVRNIPAKAKRKGINPFTKEEVTFPARPASRKIRATALKKLKDLV